MSLKTLVPRYDTRLTCRRSLVRNAHNTLYYQFVIATVLCTFFFLFPDHDIFLPREDAGGLSREYVLRIPSVS